MIVDRKNKGLICVLRFVNGALLALPLANQSHYKEWLGCFTQL